MKLRRIILPIAVIAVAIILAKIVISKRSVPAPREHQNPGVLVTATSLNPVDHRVAVRTTGTLRATQTAAVAPQVSGAVVKLSPRLHDGGVFKKGELLFALDPTDYRLALQSAKATLASAELALETARSKAEVARKEWEAFGDPNTKPSPLTLNEPQVKSAEAALAGAKAAVDRAEADLARTEIRAPFSSLVISEDVAFGQYLRSGNPVITLAATDSAEVVVQVPVTDLRWLDPPAFGKAGTAATAEVRSHDRQEVVRKGVLSRQLGDADSQGRMTRLVIRIDDPFALKGGEPLLLGSFVDVVLYGDTLSGVYRIDEQAIRPGDTLWRVEEGNLLGVIPVEVLRRSAEGFLVKGGEGTLSPGDRIVTSPLTGAAPGLKLRIAGEAGHE